MPRESQPIAYVTDLEGQWDRWLGFVDRNPLVSFQSPDDARAHTPRIVLADSARLVFGGDAIDRGPESLRIKRMLVAAKARYGDRVVLLAGNRDVNKLRLVRELGGFVPERAPAEARASRPSLLRWVLAQTMGAAEAFHHHATELAALGEPHDDAAVVESMLADLEPNGLTSRYLAACQLAFVDDTTLFVHGGLTSRSLGHVPGRESIDGVPAFVDALNAFYAESIDAFRAHGGAGWASAARAPVTPDPSTIARHERAPWQALVDYQAPTPGARVNEASVVYGRLSDEHNNPFLPTRDVVATLTRDGIQRLVLGHTPSGDTPAILRGGDFELVVGDNSRSRIASGASILVRGRALDVAGAVQLDDGETAELVAHSELGVPATLGRRTAAGRLVKGTLADGRAVLYRGLPGYVVEQIAADPETTRDEASDEPWTPPRFA